MKKILVVATVPSMIGQFNMNNIQILKNLGYEVHVACNFRDRSVWTVNRVKRFVGQLEDLKVEYHQIDFSRSPNNIRLIQKSFCQMNLLVMSKKFDVIHCHTPLAGVISRVLCHKNGIKVVYTAHGFHFYCGAPLKNWLIYYPVEKILSRWTDILITINREDYKRARKKFYAQKTIYIPGTGIYIKGLNERQISIEEKRRELGISCDEIMLLSVGELNENKNHRAVIEALGEIKKSDKKYIEYLHYFIAGKGEQQDALIELADKQGIKLHLLGFRDDVPEILKMTDIFILPSIREGLNVSLMEAMACKLPVICSRIRGNTDLITGGKGGFLFVPTKKNDIKNKLEKMIEMSAEERRSFGEYNFQKIQKFSDREVEKKMYSIYKSFFEEI